MVFEEQVEKFDREIKRLQLFQFKLIKKKELYQAKLDRAVLLKKITSDSRTKRMSKFNEEYTTLRVQLGRKWVDLLHQKIELVGKPKSVNINEERLDSIMGYRYGPK